MLMKEFPIIIFTVFLYLYFELCIVLCFRIKRNVRKQIITSTFYFFFFTEYFLTVCINI